jgi:hypothetical protein
MTARPVALLWLVIGGVCPAFAETRAPDASAIGSGTATSRYAENDATGELIAAVYRPVPLGTGSRPLVLILHGNHSPCGRPYAPRPGGMDPPGLPGNPRIDDRRFQPAPPALPRTCAPVYREVPSHEGYGYLAERLASQGFIVVSINANSINNLGNGGPAADPELILERGRLVLRHLALLAGWHRGAVVTPPGVGLSLRNKLDFTRVGLIGHSRGGEGMRAAYTLLKAPKSTWPATIGTKVTFKAIFEIAPTDFRGLDADGVSWNVLLPLCDADVSDQQGIGPFDRMMRGFLEKPALQKSTYAVWGANHNFYNTEWQLSDTVTFVTVGGLRQIVRDTCLGPGNVPIFADSPGSPVQRLTSLSSVTALVRANVSKDQVNVSRGSVLEFNRNFNTLFRLPATVIDEAGAAAAFPTRVERGYSPSANGSLVADDFDGPAGRSTYGISDTTSNLAAAVTRRPVPRHDPVQSAALVRWNVSGASTFFQTNWTREKVGKDVSTRRTLDFRVAREADPTLNAAPSTDFSIVLVGADGAKTEPIRIGSFMEVGDVRGPVGSEASRNPPADPGLHPLMQTVRIPLASFEGFDRVRKQVRAVRFVFDQTAKGALYLANVRYASTFGSGVETLPAAEASLRATLLPEPAEATTGTLESPPVVHEGGITRIERVDSVTSFDGAPGVEVELFSEDGFPIRDEVAVLTIGSRQFRISEYPDDDQRALTFKLTEDDFAGLSAGDAASLRYGTGPTREVWDLGSFGGTL